MYEYYYGALHIELTIVFSSTPPRYVQQKCNHLGSVLLSTNVTGSSSSPVASCEITTHMI